MTKGDGDAGPRDRGEGGGGENRGGGKGDEEKGKADDGETFVEALRRRTRARSAPCVISSF